MALSTDIKNLINRFFSLFDLKLETLTREKAEKARLESLWKSGYFEKPLISEHFLEPSPYHLHLLDSVRRHCTQFARFEKPEKNSVGYSF